MRKNRITHMMAGVFMIIFVLAFAVLAGRFLYIQATGEVSDVSLNEWAEHKRTASYPLSAERGKIYDNNGMTLAYDRPTYTVYAVLDPAYSENSEVPLHVEDPQQTAEALAPLLDAETTYILERLQEGLDNQRFQVEFGTIGQELSQQKRDEIEEQEIPGIYFEEEATRYYPNGVFASHILGFARETEVETEEGVQKEIQGIAGMEKEMNDILKGEDGFISYKRDRYDVKLLNPEEVIQLPEDGDDIYLTIDQKIQTLLEDALSNAVKEYNPEKINAVVMDPKTGKVLAMGSRPSYDPNNPSNVENWYNDAVSAPFEPGSTMKMFTWASAIEEGVYNGSEGYQSGSYQPNEQMQRIRDHNGGEGWGIISYDEGFAKSSNVAAAKLAWEKLGTETFLEYLHAFDFDKKTGIDLPGEVTGNILYNWPIEKITTAFGQGTTTTPIQQLKAATAIANDGKMMKPYVIDRIVDPETDETLEQAKAEVVGEPISAETADKVLELLGSVVNSEEGTGGIYQLEDYKVGGKSGTAQIPNPDGGYLTGHDNYVFSFLGMAPIEDPQLIMYVSVQQPDLEPTETGSVPVSYIFNNVMENSLHYLNIDPNNNSQKDVQTMEMPDVTDQPLETVARGLKDAGMKVTTIGNGDTVKASNYQAGETIIPTNRILLLTDSPTMPSITGWSLTDVMALADLMNLQVESFGNGYVYTQNIKKGTPLKEGAYLGVELAPPDAEPEELETTEETEESEQANEEQAAE